MSWSPSLLSAMLLLGCSNGNTPPSAATVGTPVPRITTGSEVPPSVVAFVATAWDGPQHVDRVSLRDVGPYTAFEVHDRDAEPIPGLSRSTVLFALGDDVLAPTAGDWTAFFSAADPGPLAEALRHPLDQVVTPADRTSGGLDDLSEAQRALVQDPQRTAEGGVAFFVREGRGDPPSWDLVRVTVSASPGGGLAKTREAVRP